MIVEGKWIIFWTGVRLPSGPLLKDMDYYKIEQLDNTGLVKTCCVYKNQGRFRIYSYNEKDNMNDLKYYRELANDFGITPNDMIRIPQAHTSNILVADRELSGSGVVYREVEDGVDGVITNEKRILLLTIESDCTPVFILDKKKKAVAMIHSGWRGAVSKITEKAIDKMIENYGTDKKDLLIHFGPSICGDCYEVESDLIPEFKKILDDDGINIVFKKHKEKENKFLLDVTKAIYLSLIKYGIDSDNMSRTNICTYHSGLFNSWRKEQDKTKQMLTGIMLI